MPPKPSSGLRTGVPLKVIDWNQVDSLLEAGCNGKEIASYIGVSPDTLYDRCFKEKGSPFSHYSQSGYNKGDAKLKAAQFNRAIKHQSEKMLMYLGKVRLKQTELIEEAQEELNDLRKAILEISQTVPGIAESVRQKLENASPVQDQRPTWEMLDVQPELGTEGTDSGQTPMSSDS